MQIYTIKQSKLLIHSVDIDVSEEEREFVGLNPATHYLLEVRIGNGLMVNKMEFIVATSMGKLGSNGIGEVGNKMRGWEAGCG